MRLPPIKSPLRLDEARPTLLIGASVLALRASLQNPGTPRRAVSLRRRVWRYVCLQACDSCSSSTLPCAAKRVAIVAHRTRPARPVHEPVGLQIVQVGTNDRKQPAEVCFVTGGVTVRFNLGRLRLDQAADLQLVLRFAERPAKGVCVARQLYFVSDFQGGARSGSGLEILCGAARYVAQPSVSPSELPID
jgi:hypothetical protein